MKGHEQSHADLRIILRDVGGLLALVGMSMAAPLLVALGYREYYTVLAFLISGVITTSAGGLAYWTGHEAAEPKAYHAYLIASAGWLLTAAFGALPFLFTAYLTPAAVARSFVPSGETYPSSLVHLANPLHAFFESMSAYTTTGLTMSVHEPSVGHGLLFYRSLAQWLGGAGVVVLSLAILRRPSGMSQIALYESESTGIKLRPSVLGTARAIWKIYVVLTLSMALYLAVGTFVLLPDYGVEPTLFDAINHAMAGQSTGGFSTLDDSIAGYHSYGMELLHIPPMILGALSIPLFYHLAHRRDLRILWRDVQARVLFLFFVVGIPVLVLLLMDTPTVLDPVREGLFQVISAASTTGWQTSGIGNWGTGAVLFIVTPFMIIGGSAGATVGGVKLVRAYLIGRGLGWRIRRAFLPEGAVINVSMGDRTLSSREFTTEIAEAGAFILLYVAILVGSVIIMTAVLGPEFTLADIIFEAASAQSTVGLSSDITGPSMSVIVEVLFIVQMWLGRLEIFPVLILFHALFFGIRRR
jgi:trk system potassium uptake protein TrkH